MQVEVPDKLYFRIGEVAALTSLKPSILRFWETEFKQLNPVKSPSGQRLYSRKNVELVIVIKKLLYADRLTIEGARKIISDQIVQHQEIQKSDLHTNLLKEIKEDLIRFRDLLR
jgi:DNA-binding transcriptional MerR regulator